MVRVKKQSPDPSSQGSTPPPGAISFHVDKDFLPYLAKLQEYADERKLKPGPAARELVKRALDVPERPPQTATIPAADGALHELSETVKALELAVTMTLDEARKERERLRGELAQTLRLCLLGFKDLTEEHVEEVMKTVFRS